jgi:hypothetical protein
MARSSERVLDALEEIQETIEDCEPSPRMKRPTLSQKDGTKLE